MKSNIYVNLFLAILRMEGVRPRTASELTKCNVDRPHESRRCVTAFGVFLLCALTIIPAAFGLAALVTGHTDACLVAVADDAPGPLCAMGIRMRYRP